MREIKQIVEELVFMERDMAAEKGEFSLFGLFVRKYGPGDWDLVVSASWIEMGNLETLRYIDQQLKARFQFEEIRRLSGIRIIDEDDPRLEDVHDDVEVEHGTVVVKNEEFFDVSVSRAYIITSKKREIAEPEPASPEREPTLDRSALRGLSAMQIAVIAARRAGAVIRDRINTEKEVRFKSVANPVTDVDVLAEKEAVQILQAEYPGFGIISEESDPIVTGSSYTWVIDPLDGTRNYTYSLPHVSVVVALVKDGEPIIGVTYDPIREEVFTAEKGKGAHLNGVPISVSDKGEIAQCLIGFDIGYADELAGKSLDMIKALWPGFYSIRVMGSSALGLAYAACGRVDIYFHNHVSPWDIASGMLILSEAGGRMTDRQGTPAVLDSPNVIASSPHLVDRFLEATQGLEWRK